jgi:DNA-binding beta-propeller fold protein YncE
VKNLIGAALALSLACGGHASESPPPPSHDKVTPTGSASGSATGSATTPTMAPAGSAAGYSSSTLALPGGGSAGIGMDYLLFDPHTQSVWVPAGNSGAVDVIDAKTNHVDSIAGFATKEMDRNGKKRVVGPSSAALGDGVVYVGNRGDSSVCAIDEAKHAKGACATLDSMPDGILVVPQTNEVWVTTPRDKSIRILDGKTLAQKAKLTFDGDPEGFAVDSTRDRFYTNLEDKDATLAIDVKSRKTVATWKPDCGEDGPHGLRLDAASGFLFIACSTKVETMDVAHDGALVGSADTGDGVDDLDFAAATHRLYVGAAKAATLSVIDVDAKGQLRVAAVVPTRAGARNGVVDATGKVFLSHSKGSELVVVTPPATP